MAFEDALEDLSAKVASYRGVLATEEATKNAIIMPFIGRVLGYDVFNPSEVIPEFIADIGIKKGEKVDYAIMRGGDVQMLIEAKKLGDPLNLDHAGQLVRYFHVSNARIGVLTNGQEWHFFTDLDRPNRMDERPFLRLDLLDIDPYTLPELRKLTKDAFDLESVLAAAEELKYVSAVKRVVAEQFESPTDDLVKLLASRVYDGSFTAKVREVFAVVTKKALSQYVNDRVNARLKSALQGTAPAVMAAPVETSTESAPIPEGDDPRDEIETTEDEVEGFMIVRAIAVAEVEYSRVTPRDQKSYFSVLLDDNNRKPLCRLHFNRKQKYLGLLDEDRNEERIAIDVVSDLYRHADAIRAAAKRYA